MTRRSWLEWIADRTILQPTVEPVEVDDREKRIVTHPEGDIEIWTCRTPSSTGKLPQLLALKFPGAGGRAERAGPHPFESWDDFETEIWTVNHRGYGGSTGLASIQNFSQTCEAIYAAARDQLPKRPIVVTGNSLGCLSALYLSANYPLAGVILRNPPSLANMISTRPKYVWPTLGLSKWVASQVPECLNSVANAVLSEAPALFISSEYDRVVPQRYQQSVFHSYNGVKRKFVMLKADHHHRVPDHQFAEYLESLNWLKDLLVVD